MLKTTLSNAFDTRDEYKRIVDMTRDAILSSFSDDTAYSGVDPLKLRKDINEISLIDELGLGFDETLKLIEEKVMKNLLRTWSKSYMPHLHSPALLESLSAEMIISAFNDSLDSWDQGPAATEVEVMVVKGLLDLFGYDREKGDGAFTSGGSQSNMSAIIAARDKFIQKKFNHDVKLNGLPKGADKLILYTSEISHFSMDKSAHILGLGYNAVRHLKVNDKCQIDIDAFEKQIEKDVKDGYMPFMAVATLGSTDYGSIDDCAKMREITERYGMHLHLDAAYGSALVLSSKHKEKLGPVWQADSITIDFHKMFLLPISCSAILFKDKRDFEPFNLHADYLNREEDEEEGYINLVSKGIQTTRRFDALKVLFSFKARGRKEFEEIIEKSIGNASYCYNVLKCDGSFYVPIMPEISTVTFAHLNGDDSNRKIRKELLKEGIVIGQTKMNDKVMLKLTLLNPNIEKSDLDSLIQRIKELA